MVFFLVEKLSIVLNVKGKFSFDTYGNTLSNSAVRIINHVVISSSNYVIIFVMEYLRVANILFIL